MTYPQTISKSYTPDKCRRYVARGAAWMDKVCPGWELMVDFGRLEMSNGAKCVLGQTAHCVTQGEVDNGESSSYNSVIYSKSGTKDYAENWAVSHGFNIQVHDYWAAPSKRDCENDERYAMLACAWHEEADKRLYATATDN